MTNGTLPDHVLLEAAKILGLTDLRTGTMTDPLREATVKKIKQLLAVI